MKTTDGLKQLLLIFTLILSVLLFLTGCTPSGGPALPIESINESLPEDIKTSLKGLYKKDPDDVLLAIRSIGKMMGEAESAVPYLITMIDDQRLASSWTKGFKKQVPLCKEAGIALGLIGEKGIHALVNSLQDIGQTKGIHDDLKRESVAEGLNTAITKWGADPFKTLAGSDYVEQIIQTAKVCMTLEEKPGRFDDDDPRNNLKYYKHFSRTSTREGLKVYIEVLGLIGDKRALELLGSIVPLSGRSQEAGKTINIGPFEKASLLAQYKITPLPPKQIDPLFTRILLIEFTAAGDLQRVKMLLDGGVSPDIKTQSGRPVIDLAWKKKQTNIFKALIESGASVDQRLTKNDTLLIRASRSGDHNFVQALLNHGANPSLTNNAKETALMACIKELFAFWNETQTDTKAEPYFKTIALLKHAGSPPVPKKLLKSIDKKSRILLDL